MPKHLHIALAIFIIAILASCSEDLCEGTLVLTNPISNVTLAVGDTVYIDLSNPPVFVSSKGIVSYDYTILAGVENVDLNIIARNNLGNYTSRLEIASRNTGGAIVNLHARSGCLENYTLLNITVQ